MRFDNRRHLLLLLVATSLLLLLVAVSSSRAEFSLFSLGKSKQAVEAVDKEEKVQQVDDGDTDDDDELPEAYESPLRQAKQAILDTSRSAGEGVTGGVTMIASKRDNNTPMRPSLFGAASVDRSDGLAGLMKGKERRWNRRHRHHEDEEEEKARRLEDEDNADDGADVGDNYEDEEFEDEEEEENKSRTTGSYTDRIANKKTRAELARMYVSTAKVNADGRPKTAAERARELIEISRASPQAVAKRTTGSSQPSTTTAAAKKNKLITGSYWQKKFSKAVKVTKKGLKESGKAIASIPKYVGEATDQLNAFMQLDGRGKIMAMINECNSDLHFVRKEFSQFTLSWAPIMEKGLNYLGDKNLDKMKLDNDDDELDLRRDALHSLAFGYEFMRLMIIWRENLLVAHEAFRLWLEAIKFKVETKKLEPGEKRLEVDETLLLQLRTTQSYLLLTSWMTMDELMRESRTKLDHLMGIEDDRPKNYESEFFRNIVVLQEMYDPTRDEFDRERDQVLESIRGSGGVVDNLEDVDAFFENFRNQLASKEINDFDWEVPKELEDFLTKLEPQLRRTTLVYTKTFLAKLGLRKK